MGSTNKERYLVVEVSPVEDTDYEATSYIMGETIDMADTAELTEAEVRALETDRHKYRQRHFRCLKIVGLEAARSVIQQAVEAARGEAKRLAAAEANKKAAAAKRAATLEQRKIEKAKKILAEAGIETNS